MSSQLMMVLVAAITVLVLSLTWNDHGIPIVTLCDAAPLPYNKDFGTASVVYSTGIAEKIVEVRRIELLIKLIH